MYQLNDKIKDLKPYDPVTEDSRIHLDANESFLPLPAPIFEELAAAVPQVPPRSCARPLPSITACRWKTWPQATAPTS